MSKTITTTVKSKLPQSYWRAGIQFQPGIQQVELTEDQRQRIEADPHLKIVETGETDEPQATDAERFVRTSVADIQSALPHRDDVAFLEEALAAEEAGGNRTTAVKAIQARINELKGE